MVSCCPQRPVSADAWGRGGPETRAQAVVWTQREGAAVSESLGLRPETGGALRVRKGRPGWRSRSRRAAGPGNQDDGGGIGGPHRGGGVQLPTGWRPRPLLRSPDCSRLSRSGAPHPRPAPPWGWGRAETHSQERETTAPPVESSSRLGLGLNPLRKPSAGVQGHGRVGSGWTERALGQHHGRSVLLLPPDSRENGDRTQLFAASPWSPEVPGSFLRDDRGLLAPG